MFAAALPLGIAMGAIEIGLANLLLAVLIHFRIMQPVDGISWIPKHMNPVHLLIAITVIATAVKYTLQILPNLAYSAFERRMREVLVDATLIAPTEQQHLTLTDISHISTALMQKTGACAQVLVSITGTVTIALFMGVNLLITSVPLTLVTAGGILLVGLPTLTLRKLFGKMAERTYSIQKDFAALFIKVIRNAQFLKISGLESIEASHLAGLARAANISYRKHQTLFCINSNLPFVVGTLLLVVVLEVNQIYGFVTVASLVPFIYLLNRLAGTLTALTNTTSYLREYLPYVKGMVEYVDVLFPPSPLPRQGARLGHRHERLTQLSVRELTFGRISSLTKPMDLMAVEGDTLVITGPSGLGKTTLLMTLVGIVPRLGGQIHWEGISIDDLDHRALRRQIGYAGPEPYLLDDTIRSNLLFGLPENSVNDKQIATALKVACCEFVDDLEDGLNHKLKDNGDGVSAGQKQRLSLARCILRRPDVLLLDEATANIDEATERRIIEQIHRYLPYSIILAVSHRASLRHFATQVIDLTPSTT